MEKSNYALISALYSNSNYVLYSDIYFPIIKYALVGLFAKREESHPYCSADGNGRYGRVSISALFHCQT